MTNNGQPASADAHPRPLGEELSELWRRWPDKGPFLVLLAAWLALFHLLGNSTLGYRNDPSLFGWLNYVYQCSPDSEHGYLIPFIVVGLLWWKRAVLLRLPLRGWWPALAGLVLALGLHVVGYAVQQTRISVVGFFIGLYSLTGVMWGPAWLRATWFPFALFAFCLPIDNFAERLTFPLRLFATHLTGWMNQVVLGIDVVCDGTRIFDPNGSYQYEVAAACSGIRSLMATLLMSLIYGYVAFGAFWKRAVMVLAAFPLAVAANVLRLTMIIVASEAFGQSAGHHVHESSWLSLLPYIPALGGVLLLGWWLGRQERRALGVDNPRQAVTAAAGDLA